MGPLPLVLDRERVHGAAAASEEQDQRADDVFPDRGDGEAIADPVQVVAHLDRAVRPERKETPHLRPGFHFVGEIGQPRAPA